MSGNAFVVGDRLVVDQGTIREVGSGDDDAAGALAVRRTSDVMGCSGGLEGWYGLDRDRRLRKKGEELRKFRFHLRDVTAKIIENLLGRGRNVFRIGLEGSPEGCQVSEAFLLGDGGHLRLDTVDLPQTELVDLVRRHAGGSSRVNVVLIALLAVWQRSNGKCGSALGRVFRGQECGESLVCRDYVVVDRVSDLLGQALLVFDGNARRILLCRDEKRIGVDDSLTLDREFFQQKSNRHEPILHARAKHFGDLAEDARNLLKTGDVVFVVLDGVEGNGQRQIRKAGMDAILLIDWRLVLFKVEVGDALLEDTNEEVVGELVLVEESNTRDGFKPGEEGLVGFVPLNDGFK